MKEKNYRQLFLEEWKHKQKELKKIRCITEYIEIFSDDDDSEEQN